MSKLLRLIYLLLFPLVVVSQPTNPIFYNLRSHYSIVSDRTTCIYEDYLGYIWIGTEEGLSRYTGYGSVNYKSKPGDSTSLSHDLITSIFQDNTKNLWIGTFSGLCRYSFEKDNFERLGDVFPEFADQPIHTITEFKENIWVGTDDRLIVFDPLNRKIKKVFEINGDMGSFSNIRVITADQENVWVGTSDGLYFVEDMSIQKRKSFPNFDISAIAIDQEKLFIGTRENGIVQLNLPNDLLYFNSNTTPELVSNKINDLKILQDQSVWVATNAGINILNKDLGKIVNTYQYDFDNWFGISDPVIRKIFQDKNGGVWLTTPLGGVNFFHVADNLFEYFTQRTKKAKENELLDFAILSMMPDSVIQKLWIGSRRGLSLYCPSTRIFKHFPFNDEDKYSNQILSISSRINDQLWLGTEKGLLLWDFKLNEYVKPDQYNIDDQINVVFTDQDENLWFGTQESGLLKIDLENRILKEIRSVQFEKKENFRLKAINDIVQQADGTIWVGTVSGLYRVENEQLVNFQISDEDKFTPWVNDLTISPNGNLLVSTKQSGLVMIDAALKKSTLVNKESGLRSDNISTVIFNPNGDDWWISGDKGLSKLYVRSDSIYKVENFDLLDGLQGPQFTPKAGASVADDIFFGGLSGLTLFKPTEVRLREYPLQLTFFSLSIGDKKIKPNDDTGVLKYALSVTDSIELQPEHESFSILFHGRDYIRPDSLQFHYMLENYDQNWLKTSSSKVSYTNLERGKSYTFKIKAKSRLRKWSEEKQLHIYMIPYFYETLWFKVLMVIFAVAFIALVIYIRELRVKSRQARLEQIIRNRTSELESEIKEKEITAKELEIVAEEAKKADKAKSEFLAKISHEMRTPLNGIMGLSQMAKEQENTKEKNELMDLVYRSSESLKGIINDLLDFGKMEFEKLEIYEEELDIRKLIKDLVSSFGPQIEEKNILLKSEIDEAIPDRLLGDLLRIRQVLVNLLANAIKFTEIGFVKITLMQISSDNETSNIKFSVEDTGIGIPESKRNLIFSSFEQIDNGLTRRYGGTGLGLAISQRLVKLMGGTIEVHGVEGDGALFEFELKLKIYNKQKPVTTKSTVILTEGNKILLVEDNPTNILVATKMLKKAKQEVDNATNGKEALEILENNKYDLILMDIQMPVMDGFETTQIIRKSNTAYSNIPIVALTAGVMKEDIQKCLDNGMNDFLSKPVNYKELEEMLAKYLNTIIVS